MPGKKLKLNTISSRFTLIVSVAVVGCMFAVQLASYMILRQTVSEHGQAMMRVANESISLEIEDDYYSLLQTSQLMSNDGMVGKAFGAYLRADTYMETFESYNDVEELLTTVNFSSGGKLATYCDLESGKNYLSGFQSTKEDFQLGQLPLLLDTAELVYHAVHNSQSRYSNIPVVSLARKTSFWGNDNIIIYVEKQTDVDALLEEFQKTYEIAFVFLQLDSDGCVRYSNSEDIPAGTMLAPVVQSKGDFGEWQDYFWSSRKNMFGGYSVVLSSQNEFYGDIHLQLRFFLLAVAFSGLLIIVAVVLLNELIIKKNKILQMEIERVGEGNLGKVSQRTGLQDYDLLLDRFDWMTERLHQQMRAVEAAERRNGDIEREILYYQINPHFLLNSLNSAYWQARMNIKGGIDQYLAQLTGILRYSLGKDTELPTLKKEVEILQLYLQLQEKRHDFTYTLDVQEGAYLELPTPRLFIQPIVENSIEHGMDVGDHITIRVFRNGDFACVHIWDNGVGMSPEVLQKIEENMEKHNSRAGIGLRYVKTVITAMFGDAAQMTIESREGIGTKVLLRLPIGKDIPPEDE